MVEEILKDIEIKDNELRYLYISEFNLSKLENIASRDRSGFFDYKKEDMDFCRIDGKSYKILNMDYPIK
jgi:hypothetical protein